MKTIWMVYPTRRIKGWCPTYCQSRAQADKEKERMEKYSGVKWNVKMVEK